MGTRSDDSTSEAWQASDGSTDGDGGSDSRQRRILVVEDNEVNLQLCLDVLGHAGYDVIPARSGEEALEIFERQMPDLVLLDVVMPGLSGFEVLEALRKRYNEHQLPVIMATAKDKSEDVVHAFRLGANDYVTKPLDFAVTLARVAAQLRGRPRQELGSSDRLLPGAVIESKYRIESLIGRGNFGAVYRATHLKLKRQVAVKILRTSVGTDRISFARFEQEGVSLSRLDHPNAVSVLDFSSDENGVVFLVMELLEGHTLDEELRQLGQIPPNRCFQILRPLCQVLAAAHKLGIIHRDIKPQNIFLHQTREGEEVVKMLDFGIAKLVGDTEIHQQLTLDGNSVGTPSYMAPERFLNEPYDGRSDVYSLGVTLYEMLAGRAPFQHSDGNFFKLIRMHVTEAPAPLSTFVANIPPEIDAVVAAALAKDPSDRPSPLELAERFEAALVAVDPAHNAANENTVRTKAPPEAPPTVEWKRDDR